MNNLFIEGPIQTGKSTLIRNILHEFFGPSLEGVAGFTSQRLTDSGGQLLGFRLAPADAALAAVCDPAAADNVFKQFTPNGSRVDMNVFETAGAAYLDEAFVQAKAGRARLVLLDEIGGHEMKNDTFRCRLYELLDSEIPCVGVIKSPANTRHMDESLISLNEELHRHVSVVSDRDAFESLLRSTLRSLIS